MVCASHSLALYRRRFPIPCLLPILFFSSLVSEETNFLLVFHLSALGTRRRSRMPSSDLGEGWPSLPFVVLWSPPAQSMVG